jgi:DNA-binding LacI/PurR family transcriptional regulator
MGREAARLLIRRIMSEPVALEEVHRLLPCTPVEGATVRTAD